MDPSEHGRELPGGVGALPVVIGLALGVVAFSALAATHADFDPESFGLGNNTTQHAQQLPGGPFGGRSEWPTSAAENARAHKERGALVALWLGASQLHAINEFHEGDVLAVDQANRLAERDRLPVAFYLRSMGNSNFHDHLGMYLRFRQEGVIPDYLIVALTYDDLREGGMRPAVVRAIPDLDVDIAGLSPEAREAFAVLEKEVEILAHAKADADAPVERTATEGTPQALLEDRLVGGLERAWPAYAARTALTSWAELRLRYSLRRGINAVKRTLRISSGAPPVPRATEVRNKKALDALVELAQRDGAQVILYRQPHVQGIEPFYHDRAAYDAFFAWVTERYAPRGVHVFDFEKVVPAHLYGMSNWGLVDVFHFSAEGHRLLADAVYENFRAVHLARAGGSRAVQ